MKARPILMSAPMVRALLAGKKTQTRRTIKPQPECGFIIGGLGSPACPYGRAGDALYVKEAWRTANSLDDLNATEIAAKCLDAGYTRPWTPLKYEADGHQCSQWRDFGSTPGSAVPGRYRYARFMPRWASRLTLRITDVRAQRLQVISEADSIAEGCRAVSLHNLDCDSPAPSRSYRELWERINGIGSWAANPFVWALTFEVLQKNVNEVAA